MLMVLDRNTLISQINKITILIAHNETEVIRKEVLSLQRSSTI